MFSSTKRKLLNCWVKLQILYLYSLRRLRKCRSFLSIQVNAFTKDNSECIRYQVSLYFDLNERFDYTYTRKKLNKKIKFYCTSSFPHSLRHSRYRQDAPSSRYIGHNVVACWLNHTQTVGITDAPILSPFPLWYHY